MRLILKLAILVFIFNIVLLGSQAFAEEYPITFQQEGRYVLLVVGSSNSAYQRSYMVTKTPALVLDSVLGIVWRCRNLQEDKPVWTKTDLAKIKDKSRLTKKYIIKTLEYLGSEAKIPAVVLDIEEGKVWTCSNIMDETALWVTKDLVKDSRDEENKYKY